MGDGATEGRNFVRRSLTRSRRQFSIRPVFPRGSQETGRTVVVYFTGHASSFTSFHTRVRMLIRDAYTAQTHGKRHYRT